MDEELVNEAFGQIFRKPFNVPSELYQKIEHELRIDTLDSVKINMSLKRGLIVDVEDDSIFKPFLSIGDVLLTVNDKVVWKKEFKIVDQFKGKNKNIITFAYVHFRNFTGDTPPMDDAEKREGFDYKVAVIYSFEKMKLGLTLQSHGDRVIIMDIIPKSIGSLCASVGDCIVTVNGKRQTDSEKTKSLIIDELVSNSYLKMTLERARGEAQKAEIAFIVANPTTRNPPLPIDCAKYVERALGALKTGEPKAILHARRMTVTESETKVNFHDQIASEIVIPSDVADDQLIKTPARVQAPPAVLKKQPSLRKTVTDMTEATVEDVKKPKKEKKSSEARINRSKSIMSSVASPIPMSPARTPRKNSEKEWRKNITRDLMFGRNRRKQIMKKNVSKRKSTADENGKNSHTSK